MEVQLTDLENAAFTVFVVLVTRVILAFDLNLYIPLSKVSYSHAHIVLLSIDHNRYCCYYCTHCSM
jgi:Glutamate-cysteine ligase